MKCWITGWIGVLAAGVCLAQEAPLAVAALHPVVADIARKVGGVRVDVVTIVKPGEDEHAFRPGPDDLRRMQAAALVLASGKGLEAYLDDIRGALGAGQRLVDVGATIPGLDGHHHDGAEAGHGTHEDPHWWHSVRNVQRATRVIGTAFAQARPDDAAYFRQRGTDYRDRLEQLERWVRGEIARVPPSARTLATAHDAFAYFCADYGFAALPVLGLTEEHEAAPADLRRVVEALRETRVRAIFPEAGANPKILENMVREAGVRVGGRLLADGPDPAEPTFEAMMRSNVTAIVEGLAGPEARATE